MISLIVLQGTSFCNLNCSYCFISPEKRKMKNKLSLKTLDRIFSLLFNSKIVQKDCTIVWHQGEPLVLGIPYFSKASLMLSKYKQFKINHAIQTNGTLINDDWCQFIKDNRIFITISLDGPRILHDKYRIDWKDNGSYVRTLNGVKCLNKHSIDYTVSSVVTSETLSYPDELIEFWIEHGIKKVSIFNESKWLDRFKTTHEVSSEKFNSYINKYKNFLLRLFDLWVYNKEKIEIIEFKEAILHLKMAKEKQDVVFNYLDNQNMGILSFNTVGDISTYSPQLNLHVNSDGSKPFILGNINNIYKLEDVFKTDNYLSLRKEIVQGKALCEKSCEYYRFCGGGEPASKYYQNGSFASSETYDCVFRKKILIDTVINKVIEYGDLLHETN